MSNVVLELYVDETKHIKHGKEMANTAKHIYHIAQFSK